jgi:peptidoglycan hydrolase-like protein with peptidoglycan-binding domain
MTKYRFWAGALLGVMAACATLHAALAQNPAPTPPSALDARTEAQKSAFLAMPEADRKAVQEALGWLGLYNGAIDGAFGKRTRDAVLAYQTSVGAAADGTVTATQLDALKAAAQKARAAVGFELVDERRSGVRIGAPLKILDKIAMIGGDVTLEKAGGGVALAFQDRTGADADLAALYAKLTADEKGRKISYKAMKADEFFVVAGEESARKFYTRFAKAPADWPGGPSLRGFTFSYPSGQAADFDKVALAIANSFEPFSKSAASRDTAAARAASSLTWSDMVKVAPANPPAPSAAPGVSPPPSAPEPTATGLIVAPGQALTVIGSADCANPAVDGKPAKTLRADASSGLTLLAGDFGAGAAPLKLGAGSAELVVLSIEPGATPGTAALEAGTATPTPAGEGRQAIVAALTKAASGAPVFDRKGALAALVAPITGEAKRVAGVALAEPHALVALDAIERFLGQGSAEAPAQGPDLGAGEIAREKRASVVSIVCRP